MQGYDMLRLSTIAAGAVFLGLLLTLMHRHANPPGERFECYP